MPTTMTDRELAQALAFVQGLEQRVRECLKTDDQAERDQALLVARLATPLRQKLETWIGVRALRAHLEPGAPAAPVRSTVRV